MPFLGMEMGKAPSRAVFVPRNGRMLSKLGERKFWWRVQGLQWQKTLAGRPCDSMCLF